MKKDDTNGRDRPQMQDLIKVLQGRGDVSARVQAARTLGQLGNHAAVKPLIEVLQNAAARIPSLRQEAARSLGQLGDRAALKPLIEVLQSDVPSVRQEAARSLGQLGDPAAVKPLIETLQSDVSSVRHLAIRSLGQLGDPAAVKTLIKSLQHEAIVSVRQEAARSLGQLGDPAAVKSLIKSLQHDDNYSVRQEAARSLGRTGGRDAVKSLIKSLGSDAPRVRQEAAHSLGRMGDRAALKPLIKSLQHEDNDSVRQEAARSLGQLGDRAAVEPLIEVLQRGSVSDRCEAARSLGQLSDRAAVKPLIKSLQHDRIDSVRQEAAHSLGRIGDHSAIEPLIIAIQSDDEVGQAAASALFLVSAGVPSVLTRSIEFPPEYKAAGISILSHFEDVLRSKYAELYVKVTITQEDKTVTMRIETDDGEELDKIEQTLEEYGLVVRGEMKPETLLEDREAVLQLKNRLSQAQHEIHMQREVMAYLKADVVELRQLLGAAISSQPRIGLTINQEQSFSQKVLISQHMRGLKGSLNSLARNLPEGSKQRTEAAWLSDQLDALPEDPTEAKKSPVFLRLRRLVEEIGDKNSRLRKTVKGLKAGARIAQDIAKGYNEIAQWTGWPQVPRPLLGMAKDEK